MNKKISEITEVMLKDVLKEFLLHVKRTKGLTTLLDKYGGINGKWTNPEKSYNISADKIFKILIFKAKLQELDELMADAKEYFEWFHTYVNEHPDSYKFSTLSKKNKGKCKSKKDNHGESHHG